jgi:uncharacterized protein YprB with RNaseH-like and TPR domain
MANKKLELHDIVAALKSCAKELGKTPTLREFLQISKISRRQIDKHGGHNALVEKAGLEPNFSPFAQHEINPRPPKVLFFDIETSAIEALAWGGYDQTISSNQVTKDWYVLSWSAKWQGEDELYYQDVRKKSPKAKDIDKEILKGIHSLLAEADIVVGHNSKKFDVKKLNARFIKYNLAPLVHYKSVDTLQIARKFFKFTFNTLSYLAEYLGLESKKSLHSRFPGMEMWKHCMGKVGDKNSRQEAFIEMESYNKQDVTVLEGVFDRLAPYEPSLKYSAYYQADVCSCGSRTFVKDGLYYTAKGAFQRYACKQCGKIFKDRTNLIHKDVRKGLMS